MVRYARLSGKLKKHGTILNFVGKERLSQLTQTGRHQGVIAYAAAYDYAEVDDMLETCGKEGRRSVSDRIRWD